MLRLFVALVYLGVVFGESSTQASTANGMTPTAPRNRTTPTATTNATTLPVTTNATSPPSTTNATTLPVTTNATTLPVTTNATTLPVTTNATTLPVTTNATTLPVTTNATTLPVTTNTTTLPVTTNTTNATTPIVTTNAKTTPAPTTRPPYGTYFIKNGDKYCLLAQFEAKFTIKYMQYVKEGNKSNTTTKAKQGTVVLDSNAKVNVTGSCGMLILTWNKTRPHYTLSIEFGRPKKLQASGDSSFTWWLSRVSFLANLTDNPEFPNATVSVVNASYTLFQNNSIHGTNGSYYYCKKDTKFTLKAKSKDNQVRADFMDWKVEPFVEKSGETDFGSGEDCYQDNPTTRPTESKDSDIVPIAVGCALAGLVLIVLIAYVIGRRKSHRGYEKV